MQGFSSICIRVRYRQIDQSRPSLGPRNLHYCFLDWLIWLCIVAEHHRVGPIINSTSYDPKKLNL